MSEPATRPSSPPRSASRDIMIGAALGLAAGLMVAMAVGLVLFRRASTGVDSGSTVPAVMVSRDLPAGSTLVFDALTTRPIPASLATPSVVKTEEMSEVLGSRTLIELRAGDLVYRGALLPGRANPDPATPTGN